MAVWRFLISRILWVLPVIVIVLAVNFVLTRIIPGDPIIALVGDFPAPASYVAKLRVQFGLNEPIYRQLMLYFLGLLHGDLGYSFANRQAVLSLVLTRAGNTLALMLPALVASSIVGVILGVFAASRRSRVADAIVSTLSMVGYSMPAFWLGQLLVIAFAIKLAWLPAEGMFSIRDTGSGMWNFLADFGQHWILPGIAATFFYAALVARVARTAFRDAQAQDFVITALAKGLPQRSVVIRHILPNAMMPVLSVIGFNFGSALTGTIMVEAVFSWPGLGGLFISSIGSRDYPVLQGIFLISSITVILANLLTDLLYGALDPRIRLGTQSS